MKLRIVELTLRVAYGYEDSDEQPSLDLCKEQLEQLVFHAAGDGMLSGSTDMVVDSYHHFVKEVFSPDHLVQPLKEREACDLKEGDIVIREGEPMSVVKVEIDNGNILTVNVLFNDVFGLGSAEWRFTEGDFVQVFEDSPEQAKADRQLSTYDYQPDVYRRYFTSPFDQYQERIGQPFTVLGHDTGAEKDLENPEDMYRIRFEDGEEITAWGHEVCVLKYDKCS